MARQRDYKAEYKRRMARGKALGYSKGVSRGHPRKRELGIKAAHFLGVRPGENVDDIVAKDARRVFGRRIRRRRVDIDSTSYEMRLEELKKRDEGIFDWASEAAFIAAMRAMGLTEREAYTKWFSP